MVDAAGYAGTQMIPPANALLSLLTLKLLDKERLSHIDFFCYSNANLTRLQQSGQILCFMDFWRKLMGKYPQWLYFDSKLTTYEELSQKDHTKQAPSGLMAVDSHTTLEVESLDRIYLKVIQMRLQNMGGIAWFFRKHRGEAFATAKVMAELTRPIVAAIETFAKTNAIPLIGFERGQRKDDRDSTK